MSSDDAIQSILRAVPDAMRESVVITDAELDRPGPRIVYVNAGFEQLTGFTAKEVIGRTPRILQGPRTDRGEIARLRKNLAAGESFEGETINYRKNGSEYRVHWYILPHRARPDGPITHFIGVQTDVTAARRSGKMEAILASALAQAKDGAAVLSPSGVVRFVNASFCALVSLDEEDLLGRKLLRSKLASSPAVRRAIVRHLRHDLTWNGELELPGARLAEVWVSRLHPNLGYQVGVRDITEQRRMEEITASINLTDNLGMIFAGLRHELGNPINSLKTALHVTRDNLQRFDQDKVAYYLERMIGEVSRVEYLLRSLRSFGAIDVPEPTRLDLDDFFGSFSELVRRDMDSQGIAFECVNEPGLYASADPRALHQILLNLVNNAAHALKDAERKHLALTARRVDARIEVSVTDTGAGMSPAQQTHLFQPFHTTKSEGTGMGLVIVRRLVSQMRGTIDCTSEAGRGTTMRLLLEAP